MINHDQYKLLKVLLRKKSLTRERIISLFCKGAPFADNLIDSLLGLKVIAPNVIGEGDFGEDLYGEAYSVSDSYKCDSLISEYRRDMRRMWIPVIIADVLSVIAIIISIVSLAMQLQR